LNNAKIACFAKNLNETLIFVKIFRFYLALKAICRISFHKNHFFAMKIELDLVDKGIINALQLDAKTPYAEIGKQLYVSAGTIHARIKKLERLGILKKTTVQVNYGLIGYDITCFLGIYLNKSSMYNNAKKELEKIPEIISVHYTTGQYSMFVKLICTDTNHLRIVLHDKIQKIEGIQRTETLLSLEQSIDRPLFI
jgi:Lrp/AsnC family transcriptional regulator, regulator for asnA, asnC and gidA